MKIAIWHNLPSGGGKRARYYHVRGLLERGHILEAWCPPTADRAYLPLGALIPEHVVALDWRPPTSESRLARVVAAYRDMRQKVGAMDRHCRQCAEEIARGGFDLLFANSCAFLGTAQIGRYVRLPRVLYLQEPYRPLYEAQPRLRWAAPLPPHGARDAVRYVLAWPYNLARAQGYRVQAREEWRSAQAFDSILVNSFFSRETVLRTYGRDAQVCYLGIDTGLFQAPPRAKTATIVGIGGFVPTKNIDFVIAALATLPEPRPRLIWIGNSAYAPYLAALKQQAAARQIEFVPKVRIPDQEMLEILAGARLLVQASRLEPFGFAPLEANACGLPVVAVAEGGVRETVVDGVNGLLVENDPAAMGAAIRRLLDDPALASRLGEAGRERVAERWSLDAALDRLEARLTATLARRATQ